MKLKEKERKQTTKQRNKNHHSCAQGEDRSRVSPEGTRLLYAGTISRPMVCPGDGPTKVQHD